MIGLLAWTMLALTQAPAADLEYLHGLAHEVADSAVVPVGGKIPIGGANTTGFKLRVPGGTQTYYPAFWVRDAAMMLGGDLVPADEVKGWVRVIAATQPGPEGLRFDHGLRVPGYSIPDHVALDGRACWYPGAYAEQGQGNYGHLPPADDAFYFVQMVQEVYRLTRDPAWLTERLATGWGSHSVLEVAQKAFDLVEADGATGLVVCDPNATSNRVDWGFCDSIRKSGLCLMPSLLRWQAANRLAELCAAAGKRRDAAAYRGLASRIRHSLSSTFILPLGDKEVILLSATVVGRKDDVWASAFAVWLHVLPATTERKVARHLLGLYRSGGTVEEGQVREVPPSGPFGGNWESALSGPDEYQNGGFWATPTGWFASALRQVDPSSAGKMLAEYVRYVKANRARGAPFEWINPQTRVERNANYGSSACLVFLALSASGRTGGGGH